MRIYEIKQSINGEINRWHTGSPALFIRFAGCNLPKPCNFCDTIHAVPCISGMIVSKENMRSRLNLEKRNQVVVLTGGEPLRQMDDVVELLSILHGLSFFKIVIETNGTINPKEVISYNPEVNIVMDYKLCSSGNMDSMDITNFGELRISDFVKFPVKDAADLEAAAVVRDTLVSQGVDSTMVVSPVFGDVPLSEWLDMLLKPTRDHGFTLSVQMHKLLNFY